MLCEPATAPPASSIRYRIFSGRPEPWPATLPYTGKEFLDSLDDGREVWIYGERVKEHRRASGLSQHRADGRAALRRAASRPCRGKECSADLPDRMGRVHAPIFCRAALGRGSGRRPRCDRRVVAADLWLARPLTRLQGGVSRHASAPTRSFTTPIRRTRAAGTATARSGCRLSTTRSCSRRSTATWRRARRAARPTSTRM